MGPELPSVGCPQRDRMMGVTWAWKPTGPSVDSGGLRARSKKHEGLVGGELIEWLEKKDEGGGGFLV